jgi:hypothetical protein
MSIVDVWVLVVCSRARPAGSNLEIIPGTGDGGALDPAHQ